MVDVDSIKLKLRINHSALDDQLENDIAVAKAELERVGVSESAVDAQDDPLIDDAILSYCLMTECSIDSKMYEAYEKQWIQRRDELRKSTGYRA